jgi:hypothetical protein
VRGERQTDVTCGRASPGDGAPGRPDGRGRPDGAGSRVRGFAAGWPGGWPGGGTEGRGDGGTGGRGDGGTGGRGEMAWGGWSRQLARSRQLAAGGKGGVGAQVCAANESLKIRHLATIEERASGRVR